MAVGDPCPLLRAWHAPAPHAAGPGSVRSVQDHSVMAQNFVACDREQELLLPPSLRE
jgi:hypothetical protein